MNTVINPELVAQITTLVQAWNTADRRICDMFHGWEQRSTRAGLERGFYVQVGLLPGADAIADLDDAEAIGRAVYAAYMRGGTPLFFIIIPHRPRALPLGASYTLSRDSTAARTHGEPPH